MKLKIRARKRTVINWIIGKFGSLEMLASLAGIDTSVPRVRGMLKEITTSRDPVRLSIGYRDSLFEVSMEHHAHAHGFDAHPPRLIPPVEEGEK